MYPHQHERLTSMLERAGFAAVVATSASNIAYLTGFGPPLPPADRAQRFAVFCADGIALVLPACDVPGVAADPVDATCIVAYGQLEAAFSNPDGRAASRVRALADAIHRDSLDALAEALDRLGIRKGPVGVDEMGLAHDQWPAIAARLADVAPMPAARALADARRVKAPYELECLGHALRIAEEALDAVIQALDRGMTERESARLYAAEVIKRDAWPLPPIVAMGERTWIAKPAPTERALRPGDLVRLDVGCLYKGYVGRVARMAVLGEPTPSADAAFGALQAGLDAAFAAATPGRVAREVAERAVATVREQGIAAYAPSTVGWGIGMDACEPPRLAADDETALEAGEVLQIEVAHYDIGSAGLAVRDTAMVASGGARSLNRSRHELIVLD